MSNINPIDLEYIKNDKSHSQRKIKLTTMTKLINSDGAFLVINRNKQDWPGLTFPGGHVEDNESIEESAIREVKEETGLEIKELKFVSFFEWNALGDDVRHLVLLFESSCYEGELTSSNEGEAFFVKESELDKYMLSNDFDKILLKY